MVRAIFQVLLTVTWEMKLLNGATCAMLLDAQYAALFAAPGVVSSCVMLHLLHRLAFAAFVAFAVLAAVFVRGALCCAKHWAISRACVICCCARYWVIRSAIYPLVDPLANVVCSAVASVHFLVLRCTTRCFTVQLATSLPNSLPHCSAVPACLAFWLRVSVTAYRDRPGCHSCRPRSRGGCPGTAQTGMCRLSQ